MPRPGLKLKDYQEFAQSRGYRYIADDIPKNTCTRIEGWECENGHVANISYSNFGSRKTCPSCKGRQRKVIQDYTILLFPGEVNICITRFQHIQTIVQEMHGNARKDMFGHRLLLIFLHQVLGVPSVH